MTRWSLIYHIRFSWRRYRARRQAQRWASFCLALGYCPARDGDSLDALWRGEGLAMLHGLTPNPAHDGYQPPSAFAGGMYCLDREQSIGEADAVRAALDAHLAFVDLSDPAHWTRQGQHEGERHGKGAQN